MKNQKIKVNNYFETEDATFAGFLFSKGFDFQYVRKNPAGKSDYYYGFNWKENSPRGVVKKDLVEMKKNFNTKKMDICQHCYARCIRHIVEDDIDIKEVEMICGHDLQEADIPSRILN
jgi:hypothetical protein